MKQTFERNITFKRLSENNEYYRYIFKKTEKIISAVFYILSHNKKDTSDSVLQEDVVQAARETHRQALDSLNHFQHAADEVLTQYAHALIALDSSLRLATASGAFPSELLETVTAEIEAVLRGINNRYLKKELPMTLADGGDNAPPSVRRKASTFRSPADPTSRDTTRPDTSQTAPTSATTQASGATSGPTKPDRRDRIRTILEAKGESTIKDISDIITDVSEKTIQRELNAMIEDNMIRRIGERRWSKYVLN